MLLTAFLLRDRWRDNLLYAFVSSLLSFLTVKRAKTVLRMLTVCLWISNSLMKRLGLQVSKCKTFTHVQHCVFVYVLRYFLPLQWQVSIGVRNSDFLLTSIFNTGLPSFTEQEMWMLVLMMVRATLCTSPAEAKLWMYLDCSNFTNVGKRQAVT